MREKIKDLSRHNNQHEIDKLTERLRVVQKGKESIVAELNSKNVPENQYQKFKV